MANKRKMRLPNGIGSVHKIDGKNRRNPWRARVPSHIDLDMESGRATQKYINIGYFATEKEAIAALFEYQKNPYNIESASATFADVVELWKKKKYDTISLSTQRAYNSAYKNCAPLHNIKMRDIRAFHLEQLMDELEGGFQLQARCRTFLGMIFKYAEQNDIVEKNYAKFLDLRDKNDTSQRTAISEADIAQLWQMAERDNWIAKVILIYIHTGFRPAELLEVRKSNVDLDSRIIIGGGKTKAGTDRHVPIHEDILPFVQELMQTDGEFLLMENYKGKLRPFTYPRWRQFYFDKFMEENKMNYTNHYTRHTCATLMREADIDEDIRKLILGHSSSDITDRYTHISDDTLVQNINLIHTK